MDTVVWIPFGMDTVASIPCGMNTAQKSSITFKRNRGEGPRLEAASISTLQINDLQFFYFF